MSCRKGTRSSLDMCKSKQCNYEELRYKKKKINNIKETEERIITKQYKNKLHKELLKKVETIYESTNQFFSTYYIRIIIFFCMRHLIFCII